MLNFIMWPVVVGVFCKPQMDGATFTGLTANGPKSNLQHYESQSQQPLFAALHQNDDIKLEA